MAACEKCWADAHLHAFLNGTEHADEYARLLEERTGDKECTPEQQRGDRAAAGPMPDDRSRWTLVETLIAVAIVGVAVAIIWRM